MCISIDIFVPSIIDEIYIYMSETASFGNGSAERYFRFIWSSTIISRVYSSYINKMVEKPIRSARGEMYRNFTMIALVIVFKNK